MYFFQIIRSFLINVVVEPIGEEQVSVSTPSDMRRLARIVVQVVVLWFMDGQAFGEVALILSIEGIWFVFRVACNKDFASSSSHHHTHAALRTFGNKR